MKSQMAEFDQGRRKLVLRFLLGLWACTFFAGPGSAGAEVVVLNTKSLCQISVNSVRISEALVIGDATVMEEFLRDKVVVYIHSCEYWLANTDPKLSEVQYVMQHFVHTETSVYAVPKSTILIKLAKPTEFLQLASSGLRGPPAPPDGTLPPIPPSGSENAGLPTDAEKRERRCEVDEMCVSPKGDASVKLNCGGITVSASTHGIFKVGVSGDSGSIEVPFGATSEQRSK